MAEENDKNSWINGDVGQEPGDLELAPNVPEPPHEVKIRTMQSDIESMVASGGTGPKFKSVKVSIKRPVATEEEKEKSADSKKNSFLIPLVVLVALGVIGAGAFLFYNILPPPSTNNNKNNQSQNEIPTTTQTTFSQPNSEVGSLTHKSFFKRPADKTLALVIRSTAQNSFDLQTYSQKILSLLPSTSTSGFFEIDTQDENGKAYDAIQLFSYADVSMLDPAYIFAHFNPDVTMFVYKDKNGAWPGYILQLQLSENWLFLKNDVASSTEQTAKIGSVFLSSPGNADPSGFQDVKISDQPMRELGFSASGAAFVYGWYQGYLIMSTSEGGLKEAIARL